MPTPANVAGAARRRQPGFDKGFGDGVDLCWLDPQAIPGVVPANAKRAVTADARAQATAGEGMTIRAGCSRWTMMPTGSSKRGAPNVNSPPVSRHPLHRWGVKPTLFGKHQLDQHPGPHGA
jgi:hypothetical protein